MMMIPTGRHQCSFIFTCLHIIFIVSCAVTFRFRLPGTKSLCLLVSLAIESQYKSTRCSMFVLVFALLHTYYIYTRSLCVATILELSTNTVFEVNIFSKVLYSIPFVPRYERIFSMRTYSQGIVKQRASEKSARQWLGREWSTYSKMWWK